MTLDPTQGVLGSQFFTRTRFIQPPVAKESLVAWYPFREGTGADITAGDSDFGDSTDYSATVNGATYQPSGGVTDIQTGANSGAFDFDGTDDTLTSVRGVGGTSVTILAQLKLSNSNTEFARLYSSNPRGESNGYAILPRLNPDELRAIGQDPQTIGSPSTPLSNPVGRYIQVGLRYDGQTLDVIKDGQVANSTSLSISPTRNQAVLGNRPNGTSSEFLGGTVDSLRIYQAALSDSQINQIYLNTEP